MATSADVKQPGTSKPPIAGSTVYMRSQGEGSFTLYGDTGFSDPIAAINDVMIREGGTQPDEGNQFIVIDREDEVARLVQINQALHAPFV